MDRQGKACHLPSAKIFYHAGTPQYQDTIPDSKHQIWWWQKVINIQITYLSHSSNIWSSAILTNIRSRTWLRNKISLPSDIGAHHAEIKRWTQSWFHSIERVTKFKSQLTESNVGCEGSKVKSEYIETQWWYFITTSKLCNDNNYQIFGIWLRKSISSSTQSALTAILEHECWWIAMSINKQGYELGCEDNMRNTSWYNSTSEWPNSEVNWETESNMVGEDSKGKSEYTEAQCSSYLSPSTLCNGNNHRIFRFKT